MAVSKPVTEKQKRLGASLTQEEKATRREKLARLTNDLTSAQAFYNDEAKKIAMKHGRSLGWTSCALHLGGKMLKKKHTVHTWNAFISHELQAVNADLHPGSRYHLPAFIKANHTELQVKYSELTIEDKQKLEASLRVARFDKQKHKRATPKAIQKDVDMSFEAMDQEWNAVAARTGIEGFFMAVHGDVEHYHHPKAYFSPKAHAFFKDALGLDSDRIAMQFEGYVIGGVDTRCAKLAKRSVTEEIGICCGLIQAGLNRLLKDNNIDIDMKMNYANYEGKIVEQWGAELQGWPEGKVANPGSLHARFRVRNLLAALESDECAWVKLTDDEVDARRVSNKEHAAAGEDIYKPRKKPVTKVSQAMEDADEGDED